MAQCIFSLASYVLSALFTDYRGFASGRLHGPFSALDNLEPSSTRGETTWGVLLDVASSEGKHKSRASVSRQHGRALLLLEPQAIPPCFRVYLGEGIRGMLLEAPNLAGKHLIIWWSPGVRLVVAWYGNSRLVVSWWSLWCLRVSW